MAGKVFISDLKDRDRVSGTFLVQQKTVPLNKNGKPYIALVLMDKTGSMEGRIWDNVDQIDPLFATGDYVEIGGSAVAYQGRVQLKIERLRKMESENIEPEDFLPASRNDRGEMLSRLRTLLSSIRQVELRRFVLARLEDESFRESFIRAPAAKTIHHAFLSGLLEHTLAVVELANRVVDLYPTLDRDLLLAGAFFHDLGKIRELGSDRSFEYTDEGRLLGHIVMGATMVTEWSKESGLLSEELQMKLVHMILAHHGSYEFGSPKQPMFAEALVLNYLDDLDSKIQAIKEVSEREQGQRWSSFQKPFDRYLFLGAASDNDEEAYPDSEPARQETTKNALLRHPAPDEPLKPQPEERRQPSSSAGQPLELFQETPSKTRES